MVENFAYSSGALKKRLIQEGVFEHKCYGCGARTWRNIETKELVPINLELEHKNGNHCDNRLENLTLLCPNCHSYTKCYRGRNKENNHKKHTCKQCGKEYKRYRNSGLCVECDRVIVTEKRKRLKIKKEIIKKEKVKKEYFCICGNKISKDSKTGLCFKCYQVKARFVDRPSLEVLKNEIKELGYCAVGRKYGVTDNAIRKWLKNS